MKYVHEVITLENCKTVYGITIDTTPTCYACVAKRLENWVMWYEKDEHMDFSYATVSKETIAKCTTDVLNSTDGPTVSVVPMTGATDDHMWFMKVALDGEGNVIIELQIKMYSYIDYKDI